MMNSRGSVLPVFIEQSKNNSFTITHKDMIRFNITLRKSGISYFCTFKLFRR